MPFHAAAAGSTAWAISVRLRRFRGGRLPEGPRLRTTAVVRWSPASDRRRDRRRSLQLADSGACVAVPTATQARLTPADAGPHRHSPPRAVAPEVPCPRGHHRASRGPAVDLDQEVLGPPVLVARRGVGGMKCGVRRSCKPAADAPPTCVLERRSGLAVQTRQIVGKERYCDEISHTDRYWSLPGPGRSTRGVNTLY